MSSALSRSRLMEPLYSDAAGQLGLGRHAQPYLSVVCAHLALVAGDISDDPAVMRPNDAVLRIDFAQASIAIVCGRFDLVSLTCSILILPLCWCITQSPIVSLLEDTDPL